MTLHRLAHRQKGDVVVIFDRVVRYILPLLFYPCLIVGLILLGLQYHALGYVIIFGGIIVTIVIVGLWVYRGFILTMKRRTEAIKEVKALSHRRTSTADESAHVATLRKVFRAFDTDGGGSMDNGEMRSLLEQLHRGLPRIVVSNAMVKVREISGVAEELNFDKFVDAFEAATHNIKRDMHEHAISDEDQDKQQYSQSNVQAALSSSVGVAQGALGAIRSGGNALLRKTAGAVRTTKVSGYPQKGGRDTGAACAPDTDLHQQAVPGGATNGVRVTPEDPHLDVAEFYHTHPGELVADEDAAPTAALPVPHRRRHRENPRGEAPHENEAGVEDAALVRSRIVARTTNNAETDAAAQSGAVRMRRHHSSRRDTRSKDKPDKAQ